jgi:transposase-like protein
MVGHGQKLGRKKEAAIAALLSHRNVDEAAQAVDVGATTLWRWLKLPQFQAEYRKARRDAFSQSIARLQQGTAAAATTLLKTMIDPATPPSVRVRAAEAIFNHAAKAIEIEDIEARVTELEQSLAESKPGRGV